MKVCVSEKFGSRLFTAVWMTLPYSNDPHDSGPIQWARGGCGAKAPPLAACPWGSHILALRTHKPAKDGFGWKKYFLATPVFKDRPRQTDLRSDVCDLAKILGDGVRIRSAK